MIRNLFIGLLAATVFATGASTAQAQTINRFITDNGGTLDSNFFDFDILRRALATAGLTGALQNRDASLTLFAPNDLGFVLLARDFGFEGFNERQAWNFLVGVLTEVGEGDPIPPLTSILLYHVAPQELDIFDVIFADQIEMLDGQTIDVINLNRLGDQSPDQINPRVLFPLNNQYSNGFVHGINRVLLPFNPF